MIPVRPNLVKLAAGILLLNFAQLVGLTCSLEEGKKVQSSALLKGTCFDQRGFALPGVALLVRLPAGDEKGKEKRWRMQSDRRGEFAVRLPAGMNTFEITAKKKGFEPQERSVDFHADEQQHVVIQMKAQPASK